MPNADNRKKIENCQQSVFRIRKIIPLFDWANGFGLANGLGRPNMEEELLALLLKLLLLEPKKLEVVDDVGSNEPKADLLF